MHASSRARFEEGYRKIAERAEIAGWDRPEADILRLVYNWLCNETRSRWVMIIDNADDFGVFSCPTDKKERDETQVFRMVVPTLLDLLPQSPNGSILITSRSRDGAFGLTGSYADIIRVDPMDEARALTLLYSKLDENFEENDAAALVMALDYMPLAISQAAAYISQRAPLTTLSRYLQDIRKDDGYRTKLLSTDVRDSRRDGTASNSIIATWQISFEYIYSERISATRLLSLMSLFDRQGIPEDLLRSHYQKDGDDNSDVEDDLNMLMNFSLVATDKQGHQFEMHRLVQFSTRKWLELHGELETWKGKYVRLMDDSYPVGRYENWRKCQALFPHAQAIVTCRPDDKKVQEVWASVLFKAAWYAREVGKYQVAEEMNRVALEAREAILGAEHPSTLSSMGNLASTYRNQGRWKEAEELFVQVMETRKRVLGEEHPDMLTSMANLAFTLKSQSRDDEAISLIKNCIRLQKQILGQQHPYTESSLKALKEWANKG